jgi:NitT/TauT family transport system permease protein
MKEERDEDSHASIKLALLRGAPRKALLFGLCLSAQRGYAPIRALAQANERRRGLPHMGMASFPKPKLGWLVLPLSFVAGIALWAAVVQATALPAFILPGPDLVWQRFLTAAADGSLLRHGWVTLQEVLLGLLFGVLAASGLGYLLAKSRRLERALAPYVVASQSVPIVAIAPLLVIWFGPGLFSKVLICSLIVFFPVLINTVVGLHSVPEDLRDLMRSLRASRWQTFRLLELPASMPVFLGGLRIGATLAVIGAVVGEFVGADRGLGFLINVGRGQYDTALVFVAVFVLIALALLLYGLVTGLETRLLWWQKASN